MRTVSRRYRWSFSFLLVFTLLSMCFPLRVHADGGASNLAYVLDTPSGVSVIDVLQGRVTKIISVASDPHTILLSLGGRLLHATQPGLVQGSVFQAAPVSLSSTCCLDPVFAGTTLPKEPLPVIRTDAPPESVAITSDGQLGFIAPVEARS